jgi:hypothetical protein
MNPRILAHFLGLPPDHDTRNITHFAPIIPPNLKLVFNLPGQPPEKDTKDTKVFHVDLPAPKAELKLKLRPNQD